MSEIIFPDREHGNFILENGEERAAEYSDRFLIPPREERDALVHGDIVKLMFTFYFDDPEDPEFTERMWVIVREKRGDTYLGVLDNVPMSFEENDEFWLGSELPFRAEHVIDITDGNEKSARIALEEPRTRWPWA